MGFTYATAHGSGVALPMFCTLAFWGGFASDQYDPQERIESAWLYGNMNKYAYYFADLLIGSPEPQRASVIVDTGSRLVGFPCKGCIHCGDHLDPSFDMTRSKTAIWQNCSKGCAKGCYKNHCPYRETYSEGSTISGFWFEDLVELGDSLERNPPVRARLGCHNNENKLFYTQRANGIMGLAPSDETIAGQPTFLQDLFKDKPHVNKQIFSLCLATWGGKISVGGYDSSLHKSGETVQWVGMRASHYYFVFPEGVTLDDVTVSSGQNSFGVTIIDSGTTYTYLPGPIYKTLVQDLNSYCLSHEGCGARREGSECWRLDSGAEGPSSFPVVKFQFGEGIDIEWRADGYLHQRGEPNVWCQTFMENNLYQTVLGISWMVHKDVIFDIQHGRLGVAQSHCPEHRRQSAILEETEALETDTQALLEGFAEPPASAKEAPNSILAWKAGGRGATRPFTMVVLLVAGLVAVFGGVATWGRRLRLSDKDAASPLACHSSAPPSLASGGASAVNPRAVRPCTGAAVSPEEERFFERGS